MIGLGAGAGLGKRKEQGRRKCGQQGGTGGVGDEVNYDMERST